MTNPPETILDPSSWDYPEPATDDIPHGTRNGYQYWGCRGARCRAANTQKCLEQRARARARARAKV